MSYIVIHVKSLFSQNKRQRLAFAVFGLFTLWEQFSVLELQYKYHGVFPENSIEYFLLYNIGNLNNSLMMSVGLYVLLTFALSRITSSILSSIITAVVFCIMEWNDPMDIPFSIVGITLFALVVEKEDVKKT